MEIETKVFLNADCVYSLKERKVVSCKDADGKEIELSYKFFRVKKSSQGCFLAEVLPCLPSGRIILTGTNYQAFVKLYEVEKLISINCKEKRKTVFSGLM